MKVGEWVARARAHNRGQGRKLTQQELADELSVSKQNVSAWENGHHEPSINQFLRIAAITGYPIAEERRSCPLSEEVLTALSTATADDQRRIENQIRAYFELPASGSPKELLEKESDAA